MDLMQAIAGIPGIGPALPYIMALVSICAALATIVPPSWGPFHWVVNWVALNLGQAKNATDTTAAGK